MKKIISIPETMANTLRGHFFQNELEQGAFLFAALAQNKNEVALVAKEFYLIPPDGWEVQMDVFLQMKDSEQAKIMKMARDKNLCAIDCHSHPRTTDPVWFSPSDVAGITDFAQYAKWKLPGKPFAAMVWSETSLDAVLWDGEFTEAKRIDQVQIFGDKIQVHYPTNSWRINHKRKHRYASYE